MSNTAMPAYRPTASCIWLSFLSSGKRHLFITGGRKSGKSTLLDGLLPHPLPGLTSHAVPGKAVYLQENRTDAAAIIGRYDNQLPGCENKMIPCPDGFLQFGLPALQRCMKAQSEWVSIDEIGYLEDGCTPYRQAILQLMEQKRLIAVIRKQELSFGRMLQGRDDIFWLDLDCPFGNAACVIMASGVGRRFGGNKLMADFDQKPLICHVLEATEGIFQTRVVVTRHKDVETLCLSLGIPVVMHAFPYRSDTIRLGLEAAGDAESCMFCPADQPLLRRETTASLAISAADDPSSIWRAACGSTHGSPVVFPKSLFSELTALPDGAGGAHVIRLHPEIVRTLNLSDPCELMDVDSPEDLQKLLLLRK